jgi:hypothetical protein
MLEQKIDYMIECWKAQQGSRRYKEDLFTINEGDLYPYVDAELRKTLGAESQSYQYAKSRIPPINLLQKIVTKLSKIYSVPPARTIFDGSDQDQALLEYYEDAFQVDQTLDLANEFYNLTKISFVMPTYDPLTGRLFMKVLLPHQFLPFGWDRSDRTKMTALMALAGVEDNIEIFHAYTDDEFIIFNEKGERLPDEAMGVNIYGKIPGAYIKRSRSLLYPKDDTDIKKMTTLIPTMMADLNHASMFSAFSVMYGVDIDEAVYKYAPNSMWFLRSDPDTDKKPEIGTIKPQADIDATINLIVSQLSLWLNSKGIRPGSVGKLTGENMVSGVSKIVDEMDSVDNRRAQALVFKSAEENQLWPLIMHHMHPVWRAQGLRTNQDFSATASVMVEFPEQEALRSRDERIASLKAEVDAGFMSKRMAIKKLNPDLGDEEIDELIREIEGSEEVQEIVPVEGDEAES